MWERQLTLTKLFGGLSYEKIRRYNNSPPYVMARWLPQQIPPLNFLELHSKILMTYHLISNVTEWLLQVGVTMQLLCRNAGSTAKGGILHWSFSFRPRGSYIDTGIRVCACLLVYFFANFGIAIKEISSQTKVPNLHKLGVF